MKLFNSSRIGLVVLALMWAMPLAAQSMDPKPLVITAINTTAESAKSAGAERKNPAMAQPGDVIGYSLAFTNVNRTPVNNVRFVDPLPQGLVYLPGSASADKPAQVEYSIDGGKTFVSRPVIVVVENGKQVEKPAPREAYTHIRWTVSGPLAPGAQVTAAFQAEVSKAATEAK